MSMQQTQKYCTNCKGNELHARPGTNHVLHLLITLLLCGFWLPIWILSALKIGGWRCQRCGSGGGSFGILPVLAAVLILSGVLFTCHVGSEIVNSARSKSQDQPEQAQATPPIRPSQETPSQPKAPPQPAEPLQSKPPARPEPRAQEEPPKKSEPLFIESLKDISIPVTLEVVETFNLFDAAGKEVPIPIAASVLVQKRTPGGTLTMIVGGKLYVGHESRLSKKVRIASD